MTSKIIVNTIEADTGISSITFASNINLQNDASVLVSSNGVRLGTGSTIAAPSANEITLSTNGTERVRVDSSGNVGIGTDNPEYDLDFGESPSTIRLISENNGTTIRIGAGGNANQVTLLRVDGSNPGNKGESNDSDFGFSVKYMGNRSGNNNSLSIFSDNQNGATQVEAITINQDGSTGIGTDTTAEILTVAGNVRVQNSADAAQYLNLTYQGIDFQNTGAGSSTTSSAHLLDDYEEGTWTPVYTGATSAGTYTYTTQTGVYTKIGNRVTVDFKLLNITTGSVGSGNVRITGLPYLVGTTDVNAQGSVRFSQHDVADSTIGISLQAVQSIAECQIILTRDNTSNTSVTVADKTTDGADIYGSVTYNVD